MEDYSVIVEKELTESNPKQMKSKQDLIKEAALKYHSREPMGKIEVKPTKPCFSQYDLTLAYTPGVAQPCLEIQKDEHNSRIYTAKGNLVAVVSNGTAVLGLGNIGALAGKPVMEGKGVLFKRFADIDVFDIEIDKEAECKKLNEEKKRIEGFLFGVQKKLSNERFVNNAPAPVVEKEKQKLADGQEKLRLIEKGLKNLGC